jgi:dihydrofolate reductase
MTQGPERISLVVAYAKGGVIGKDGGIPWRLPDDLRHLRRLTLGHTVVMGRRTYESIGKPLDQRLNVVLTRDPEFHADGVRVIHHPDEVFSLTGEVFILGGATLYERFLPVADRLYITEIEAEVEGDTFFPEWDRTQFRKVSEQAGRVDERNPLAHTFYVYERVQPHRTGGGHAGQRRPLPRHAIGNMPLPTPM